MLTSALVLQACLAGFLIYPVIVGFYTWNRSQPDWLWVFMALWSLVSSALLAVNVAYLWPETPASLLGALLSVRHVLVGLDILLVLAAMFALSGRTPKILISAIVALLVIRAILWFTTDLVWTGSFNADRVAEYGPLRNPASLLFTALVLAAATYTITRRPWKSELARRGLLYAMVPGVVLSILMVALPGVVGEFFVAFGLVPSLIALQLMYFSDFRRNHQRTRLIAEREARLASFGTDVLAESAQVPELAAVTLVSDMLGARCTYTVNPRGEPQRTSAPTADPFPVVVADSLAADTTGDPAAASGSENLGEICVPVEVAGSPVGVLRAHVAGATEDDRSFVQAVGAVLSAALNRSHVEALLRDKALRDELTGLPNWTLLLDRLGRLLNDPRNLPVGVLCGELHGLKDVNDQFGHDAGDDLLRIVSQRLTSLAGSQGTVARVGADDFVLIHPSLPAPWAEELAQDMNRVVSQSVDLEGGEYRAALRVGFTIADSVERSADRLVRDAELAVMLAKHQDAATVAYSEPLRRELEGRREMIRGLREAIDAREITLEYQPIVDLATMQITGVEALARWRNHRQEQIPPTLFVRLAEEIGVMRDLGALVFEEGIRQLAQWSEYPPMRSLRLSLNLAPTQIEDRELVSDLEALLKDFGIDPTRVTLEVTESGLEQATESTAHQLHRFRELGLGLSLDDFGTGYSTLTRLMEFPVTELKVDRQFTSESEGSARAIVPAIVGLAHASGLQVVAEGIETERQCRLAKRYGCDFGQGYLFSRPLPPADLPAAVGVGQSIRIS